MKTLEVGIKYELNSVRGTNNQTIQFLSRQRKELTFREFHESESGEKLSDYFFEQMDLDPSEKSGNFSSTELELVDGTSVEEVLKMLVEQFTAYQETIPCDENEESLEYFNRVLELQKERGKRMSNLGDSSNSKS